MQKHQSAFLSVKFSCKSSLFPDLHFTFKWPGFSAFLLSWLLCRGRLTIQVPLWEKYRNDDISEAAAEDKQHKVYKAESRMALLLPVDSRCQHIYLNLATVSSRWQLTEFSITQAYQILNLTPTPCRNTPLHISETRHWNCVPTDGISSLQT